jgi:hypothetical protein
MDWKPKGLIFLGSKGIPTPNHATQLFISKLYTWKKKTNPNIFSWISQSKQTWSSILVGINF